MQAYLYHGLWIALMISSSIKNSSAVGQWILLVAVVFGLISLGYMIIRKNYMEVIDNKLFIYESILQTKAIDLEKIEKFDFEPGPFTSSKIILKDKTKLTYSDSQAELKKLKVFMKQFNIPVE